MSLQSINGSKTITFGNKHYGETYSHVYDSDPEYCHWILSHQFWQDEINDFKQYASVMNEYTPSRKELYQEYVFKQMSIAPKEASKSTPRTPIYYTPKKYQHSEIPVVQFSRKHGYAILKEISCNDPRHVYNYEVSQTIPKSFGEDRVIGICECRNIDACENELAEMFSRYNYVPLSSTSYGYLGDEKIIHNEFYAIMKKYR